METLPEVDESRDSQNSDPASTHVTTSTPVATHKSPKNSTAENGHISGAAALSVDDSDAFDPQASTPLLVNEVKNSSNSNANEYSSGDSEKDALIMSTTSGN